MNDTNPFKYFKTSREIIKMAVLYYVRFGLSLRQVEDLLHLQGIDICHESVRYWVKRFGPIFAGDIRKRRVGLFSLDHVHIDEVFVKVNGIFHLAWRVVDHEGTVLLCYISKRRDKRTALKLLKKMIKQFGVPNEIVTDKLKSYRAALRELGLTDIHETSQYANNLIENSHLHLRRRERAMCRFRSMENLQRFTSTHAQFHNLF